MLTIIAAHSQAAAGEWKELASLPNKEGFAGSFAGVSHGALVVAGGANFVQQGESSQRKKVWHDTVFVLERPGGAWKIAGKLPRPLGYGVSVTHNNSVVCVGGSDESQHYGAAFRLQWNEGRLVTTPLRALPTTVANACGALVGNVLYVAGGLETPSSTTTLKSVWRLDLAAKSAQWEEVAALPGEGRMLAAAAGFDGSFWVVGGVDLLHHKTETRRRYLTDGYRYDPRRGWQRIADLPHAVVAAPSPAPSDASGFYLLGGDDGTQVSVAREAHRGFSKQVLRYDATKQTWLVAGQLAAPRVTVPLVTWNELWVVPSGEVRPGVRSPEVWAYHPEN